MRCEVFKTRQEGNPGYAALLCALLLVVLALPARAADTTVTVGINAFPASKGNPYSGIYVPSVITWSALFESLTHVDAGGNLVPWIATAWEQTSDTTWRFKLRPGLVFANGEALDAHAVAAAVGYITGLGRERSEPAARELDHVVSARALTNLDVEIITSNGTPFLPQELTNLRLVPPKAWQDLGVQSFSVNPIGSGPFQVETWTESRLVLTPNLRAWRKPKIDRLILQPAPNISTRLQALQSGDLDIATSIPADAIEDIEAAGGTVYTVGLPGAYSIILNMVKTPAFRDVRVRQALNHAVNKDIIIEQLLAGRTLAVSQPAAHVAFGYDDTLKPYVYDPDKARQLLTEAGYAGGLTFVLESSGGVGTTNAIYQQVAANLALVGVTMVIRIIPITQMLANIQSGDWQGDAFAMSYFTGTFDAMRPQRNQSCLWVNPWFCDEAIMPTIEAAFAESDVNRREVLTRQVMNYAHNNAQGLFLYENVAFDGLAPGIEGYRSDYGFIHYDAVRKTEAGQSP